MILLGSGAASVVARRLAEHHIDATLYIVQPAILASTVRQVAHAENDAVIVGGGDGTVRTAAAEMIEGTIPLGILPLGTFNHFARDLGIPAQLTAAVAALAHSAVQQVDVGELNGEVFLNNSCLGLYPEAVRLRELERQHSGTGKWVAFGKAMVHAVAKLAPLDVRISTERGEVACTTPFVFIGNNAYDLRLPFLGRRSRIDTGELWLYVGDRLRRRDLFTLSARAVLGRLEGAERLGVFHGRGAIVQTPGSERVRVSLDGEILHLAPPLYYRIAPRALPVLVPTASYAAA